MIILLSLFVREYRGGPGNKNTSWVDTASTHNWFSFLSHSCSVQSFAGRTPLSSHLVLRKVKGNVAHHGQHPGHHAVSDSLLGADGTARLDATGPRNFASSESSKVNGRGIRALSSIPSLSLLS